MYIRAIFLIVCLLLSENALSESAAMSLQSSRMLAEANMYTNNIPFKACEGQPAPFVCAENKDKEFLNTVTQLGLMKSAYLAFKLEVETRKHEAKVLRSCILANTGLKVHESSREWLNNVYGANKSKICENVTKLKDKIALLYPGMMRSLVLSDISMWWDGKKVKRNPVHPGMGVLSKLGLATPPPLSNADYQFYSKYLSAEGTAFSKTFGKTMDGQLLNEMYNERRILNERDQDRAINNHNRAYGRHFDDIQKQNRQHYSDLITEFPILALVTSPNPKNSELVAALEKMETSGERILSKLESDHSNNPNDYLWLFEFPAIFEKVLEKNKGLCAAAAHLNQIHSNREAAKSVLKGGLVVGAGLVCQEGALLCMSAVGSAVAGYQIWDGVQSRQRTADLVFSRVGMDTVALAEASQLSKQDREIFLAALTAPVGVIPIGAIAKSISSRTQRLIQELKPGQFRDVSWGKAVVESAYDKFKLATAEQTLSIEAQSELFQRILSEEAALKSGLSRFSREGNMMAIDTPAITSGLPRHLADAVTRDHHGIFGKAGDINSGIQIMDDLERATQSGKLQEFKNKYKYCVSDNLADGAGMACWIAANANRLAADPKLRERVRRLSVDEDFNIFGVGFNTAQSEDTSALLSLYDNALKKYGAKGSDRIDMLPTDVQKKIVQEVQDGITNLVSNPRARAQMAQEFEQRMSRVSATVEQAQVRDPALSKVFVVDGNKIKGEGVFSDWVATPQALKRANSSGGQYQYQLSLTQTPAGKTVYVFAVPRGLTGESLAPAVAVLRTAERDKIVQMIAQYPERADELRAALQSIEVVNMSRGEPATLAFNFAGSYLNPDEIRRALSALPFTH